MLNPNLTDLEVTNVFIAIASKNDSNYLQDFYGKIMGLSEEDSLLNNGLKLKQRLKEELDNDFIFEGAISHYYESDNPKDNKKNKELLTRRLNTLVLTALNSEGCPIDRKELTKRKGFDDMFSDLTRIYEMPLEEYKSELLEVIPEIVIMNVNTNVKSYLEDSLEDKRKTVELMDIPSLTGERYSLKDALQITLATNKDNLTGILTEDQINDIKSLGFIQGDVALEVCFNQVLYNNKLGKDYSLGLFIHLLQHFYHHPLVDKTFFEEELIELLEEVSSEYLPLLSDVEIEEIANYFIKEIKTLK